VCGDGVVEAPEACDDGVNDGAPGGCAVSCADAAPEAGAFPRYQLTVIDVDGATRSRAFDRTACAPSPSPACAGMCVEDGDHCADIAYLGGGEWRLDLRIKPSVARVPLLGFPAPATAAPLGDPADDVFYYPYLSGVAERYDHRLDPNATYALTYPGGVFSPLAMLADPDDARLLFASNWPPVAVSPAYGAGRLSLWYQDAISTSIGGGFHLNGWSPGLQSTPRPGEARSYRFTELVLGPGDVPAGRQPWHAAADRYRAWLEARRGPAPAPPAWMQASHGFIGVQLENLAAYDPAMLERLARRWGAAMPWMLLWGQMSDYLGDCCATSYPLHPRYGDLPGTVAALRADGLRVGYYAAPHWGNAADPAFKLDAPDGASWLTGWLDANEAAGADAHYVDTLARTPWGQPAALRELFAAAGTCETLAPLGGAVAAACGRLPAATMIEGAVDLFPAPGLMDGGLTGVPANGMLDNTAPLSPERPFVTFPRLAYYLLPDHQLHLGGYNNDFPLAGAFDTDGDQVVEASDETPGWFWAERQAFLLGARFTGSHLETWLPDVGLVDNPWVDAVVAERDRVGFWARRPRYLDTVGLGPAPDGLEVRRFATADGGTLLAVVNWQQRPGQVITVDGVAVPLCAGRLALIDVAAPACPE
jgi:hypothetical protein